MHRFQKHHLNCSWTRSVRVFGLRRIPSNSIGLHRTALNSIGFFQTPTNFNTLSDSLEVRRIPLESDWSLAWSIRLQMSEKIRKNQTQPNEFGRVHNRITAILDLTLSPLWTRWRYRPADDVISLCHKSAKLSFRRLFPTAKSRFSRIDCKVKLKYHQMCSAVELKIILKDDRFATHCMFLAALLFVLEIGYSQ